MHKSKKYLAHRSNISESEHLENLSLLRQASKLLEKHIAHLENIQKQALKEAYKCRSFLNKDLKK